MTNPPEALAQNELNKAREKLLRAKHRNARFSQAYLIVFKYPMHENDLANP